MPLGESCSISCVCFFLVSVVDCCCSLSLSHMAKNVSVSISLFCVRCLLGLERERELALLPNFFLRALGPSAARAASLMVDANSLSNRSLRTTSLLVSPQLPLPTWKHVTSRNEQSFFVLERGECECGEWLHLDSRIICLLGKTTRY